MKKYIGIALAVLSCILTIFCLTKITSLENRLNYLQNDLSMQISNVNSTVGSIYYDIDEMLQKQASLLVEHEYRWGDADIPAQTVELHCSVTPREFDPAHTTASLICQDKEYAMNLVNGAFVVTMSIPLFEPTQVSRVLFSTGDLQQVEALDWHLLPHYEILPNVYVQWSGGASSSSYNNIYHWEGPLEVEINSSQALDVQSVSLVELQDGTENSRVALELEQRGDQYYYINHQLDARYELLPKRSYELYVEVVDGYGLHYRTLLGSWQTDENSQVLHDESAMYWGGEEADIYDAAGQLLYEGENGARAY